MFYLFLSCSTLDVIELYLLCHPHSESINCLALYC
ncbi:hypothetical protein M6B38_176870 [Iris pallida]|uniref:Uncharacterized protein n=1 Tax=Iris pallida TaxID=29817 RepID=A0AAX6EQL5_IRIPA|nr:hypothetical protein M6B38_176870 [Iris pallida]